jgi:hypothetical protein
MMKLGAVREPMFPRKLAMDLRKDDHDCDSAGGTSASDVGMSGTFLLLDMVHEDEEASVGCCRADVTQGTKEKVT